MEHIISGRKGSKNVYAVSARAITEQWARNWIYFFQIQIQGSALILNPLIRVCVSRKFTDLRLHIGFLLKLSHPLKQSNAYTWTVRREQGCHVQNSDDEVAGFRETLSVLLVCLFVCFCFSAQRLFRASRRIWSPRCDARLSHRLAILARLCSRCFWRRSRRLQSWDSGVFSFIPLIAVRFVLNKLPEGNCTHKKLNSRKCFDIGNDLPNSLSVRGGSSWVFIKNRDGVRNVVFPIASSRVVVRPWAITYIFFYADLSFILVFDLFFLFWRSLGALGKFWRCMKVVTSLWKWKMTDGI